VRATIADYERELARAAIDAGADIVLGHHAHILKGIDSYRGKLIFHNLNNFAMDVPKLLDKKVTSPRVAEIFRRYPNDLRYNEDDPTWPYSEDSRKTVILKIGVQDGQIGEVEVVPCIIQRDHSPRVVEPGEELFSEIADYLSAIGAEAEVEATIEVRDGRILVAPVAGR
jgi:poly-gamma-glutamate synthesis protein (capsule biosynthesis protein)